MHHGRWKATASCPHCRKRFTFRTRRLSLRWVPLVVRFWPALLLLAVALVLTVPAAVVILKEPGSDITQSLHDNSPLSEVARYCLYGSVAAVACGFWLTMRRRWIEEGVPG
jgi:hypothetical protein